MLTKEIPTAEAVTVKGGAIRVTIPAKAAYDLKVFQKVLGSLAERLGCRPCLSGADCFFQMEKDFVVNPQTFELESLQHGPQG
jgi:hypothetical protein